MKYIPALVACILLGNCTVEEKTRDHVLSFQNVSSEQVNVKCFIDGILIHHETIAAGQKGMAYTVPTKSFNNFGAISDSIAVTFPNNRGYLCSYQYNSYCFSNKSGPLIASETDFTLEDNIYYYNITEEDREIAFEL